MAKRKKSKKPLVFAAVGVGAAALAAGLVGAFKCMKASAKEQHQVDKAEFAAVRAESKAQWEEAKAMGKVENRRAEERDKRQEQIAAANRRKTEAEARTAMLRNHP